MLFTHQVSEFSTNKNTEKRRNDVRDTKNFFKKPLKSTSLLLNKTEVLRNFFPEKKNQKQSKVN